MYCETISTRLSGVTFNNDNGISRQIILSRCHVGDRVKLIFNPVPQDSNGIIVTLINGVQIGWIPRERNIEIGRKIKDGSEVKAYIKEITGGGTYNYGCVVNIEIYKLAVSTTSSNYEIKENKILYSHSKASPERIKDLLTNEIKNINIAISILIFFPLLSFLVLSIILSKLQINYLLISIIILIEVAFLFLATRLLVFNIKKLKNVRKNVKNIEQLIEKEEEQNESKKIEPDVVKEWYVNGYKIILKDNKYTCECRYSQLFKEDCVHISKIKGTLLNDIKLKYNIDLTKGYNTAISRDHYQANKQDNNKASKYDRLNYDYSREDNEIEKYDYYNDYDYESERDVDWDDTAALEQDDDYYGDD